MVTICTTSVTFSNFTFCPRTVCVLCGSENKQRLFPCTALTDWLLWTRRGVFTARYGLGLLIPFILYMFSLTQGLWCTKWHWKSFFSDNFCFPLSVSSDWCPILVFNHILPLPEGRTVEAWEHSVVIRRALCTQVLSLLVKGALYSCMYVTIRNTWKVLRCGAGEGWKRSVGPIMWEMKKYYWESRSRGISYMK